jgi:hypothetical protein
MLALRESTMQNTMLYSSYYTGASIARCAMYTGAAKGGGTGEEEEEKRRDAGTGERVTEAARAAAGGKAAGALVIEG